MSTVLWLTELDFSYVDGDEYRLNEDLSFMLDGQLFVMPAGSLTDGASIPRPLWSFVGPPLKGPKTRGCVIHDGGYRGTLIVPVSFRYTRRNIDRLMKHLHDAGGVPWWQRNLIYRGVRVGGRSSFQGKDGTPFDAPTPADSKNPRSP